MDHHPNRTRAARHAAGPDYTTAYLLARANGDGDMDAYIEAAEEAHGDRSDGDRREGDEKSDEPAVPA